MRALLRLYPRAWREYYGEEFAEILAAQPLSLRLLVDIVGGAVDARLRPQVRTHRGDDMTTRLFARCAAGGPQLTKREERIAAGAMIGSSALFAALYVLGSYLYRGNEFVEALGLMAFPAALLVTMPFTYMKDHSRSAKVLTVGGCLAILVVLSYIAALI